MQGNFFSNIYIENKSLFAGCVGKNKSNNLHGSNGHIFPIQICISVFSVSSCLVDREWFSNNCQETQASSSQGASYELLEAPSHLPDKTESLDDLESTVDPSGFLQAIDHMESQVSGHLEVSEPLAGGLGENSEAFYPLGYPSRGSPASTPDYSNISRPASMAGRSRGRLARSERPLRFGRPTSTPPRARLLGEQNGESS
jgi:hypothetical protein